MTAFQAGALFGGLIGLALGEAISLAIGKFARRVVAKECRA